MRTLIALVITLFQLLSTPHGESWTPASRVFYPQVLTVESVEPYPLSSTQTCYKLTLTLTFDSDIVYYELSDDGSWAEGDLVPVIMFNSDTADTIEDDIIIVFN